MLSTVHEFSCLIEESIFDRERCSNRGIKNDLVVVVIFVVVFVRDS